MESCMTVIWPRANFNELGSFEAIEKFSFKSYIAITFYLYKGKIHS